MPANATPPHPARPRRTHRYLLTPPAPLPTCRRPPRPEIVFVGAFLRSVDDVDKIVETSAGSGGGGGGGGGGGFGAAALRISALLQDTAEFFDNSRAEARAVAAAAAAVDVAGESTAGGTLAPATTSTPQQAIGGGGNGGSADAVTPQTRESLDQVGGLNARGRGAFMEDRRVGEGQEEEAVRVVSTCSTSDRGMLSLYGR